MSSLALTSGWYYICTSYCTPDINQDSFFSYVMVKEGKNNSTDLTPIVESTHVSHDATLNNTSTTHSLKPIAILYTIN